MLAEAWRVLSSTRDSTQLASYPYPVLPSQAIALYTFPTAVDMERIVRSARFYVSDGDLAIFSSPAEDNLKSITVFRVHKSILAYNSPVFKGMVELPNAPDAR